MLDLHMVFSSAGLYMYRLHEKMPVISLKERMRFVDGHVVTIIYESIFSKYFGFGERGGGYSVTRAHSLVRSE